MCNSQGWRLGPLALVGRRGGCGDNLRFLLHRGLTTATTTTRSLYFAPNDGVIDPGGRLAEKDGALAWTGF